uniref:Ig-like domain-containing protein n=1 Tax=Heterorhabditis bacteriophora TaxID=37862 RepID=A0A1I7WGL8_HETBA
MSLIRGNDSTFRPMLITWRTRFVGGLRKSGCADRPISDPLLMRLVSLFLLLPGLILASVESCCRKRGVSDVCSHALCRPESPPGDMERYTIFEPRMECGQFLPEIAECLVNGRDSSDCCHQTADRADENKCLGICRGSAAGSDQWYRFQSCLALNLSPMYSCIQNSYKTTPTQPQELKITSKSDFSVSLGWLPPSKNADLVHIYKVHVTETSGHHHEGIVYSTESTQILLSDLKPNGKYSIYVIAHAADLTKKSLPSDIVNFAISSNGYDFNNGQVKKTTVLVPRESSKTTLDCRLKMGIGSKMYIDWEKKVGGSFKRVEGSRMKVTTYASEFFPTTLVSALEIRSLENSDFGTYKCHVRGQINEYEEVQLVQFSHSNAKPPSSPPDSPLECCSRSVLRPHCQSVCSIGSERKRGLKPDPIIWVILHKFCRLCYDHTYNYQIYSYQVPYHCLGLCDNKFELLNLIGSNCLEFEKQVRQCQAETIEVRPEAVSYLKAKNDSDYTSLEWERSDKADVYHVYHRRRKGPWRNQSVTKTSAKVKHADEIVVLSVNAYGAASPNRIVLEDGEWIENYD